MNEEELLEEIKDTYIEGSFNSRWLEIETNHKIGTMLNALGPSEEFVEKVARYLKKPVDFLVDCQIFAERYPDLNETNYDKTISWSKIQKEIRNSHPVKKEKLTVKRIKEIIIRRRLANETTGNSERAFEDSDVLTAIGEYRPAEEIIKTEGRGIDPPL